MVEQHLCAFCGEQIEPGTGKMYVKKDGTTYLYCTNKCYKEAPQVKPGNACAAQQAHNQAAQKAAYYTHNDIGQAATAL